MAVYTDITDEELSDLLQAYDLGPALVIKGVAEGVENSNFFLETAAGRAFLTIYEKRVNPEDLPYFMALMEAAAEAGVACPRPIARRDGGVLSAVRGKPAALVTFLSGVSPRRPSAGQCRAVGAAMAGLHTGLDGFGLKRANSLGPGAWRGLAEPRLGEAENLRPGLAAAIAADLDALEAGWPADLPAGAIHADLFPDNVLFLGETVSGLIDFYFACTDARAYDLAVALNAWCFEPDRSFNLTKGQALIAGYRSVRPLTEEERAALPMLARGAAMRFFATRLADWAATPAGALVKPKDPLDYADRLEFHRRAKGPGDYGA